MFLLVCMVWFVERKLSHVFVIKWNSVFDTVYFCICVFDIVFCLILAKGDNVFGEEQAYSCPHQPPSPYQCPVNINTNTDHQKHTNTQTISNKNTHNYTHSFLHTNVPSTLTQTLNITNTQIISNTKTWCHKQTIIPSPFSIPMSRQHKHQYWALETHKYTND